MITRSINSLNMPNMSIHISILHLGLVKKFKQHDDKAYQIYHSIQDKLSNITVFCLSVRFIYLSFYSFLKGKSLR